MSGITVIGPGALGILFAVKLFKEGRMVSLLDYRRDRAAYLNRAGLRLIEKREEIFARPPVTARPEDLESPEYVLVLVKAYQTEGILETLKRLCSEKTLLISLQNGIGAGEILARAVPSENIFLGTTTHGANKCSEGVARHAGAGPTVIGPYRSSSGVPGRLYEFSEILLQSGFVNETVRDIYPYLWRKVLVNVGINPLTALTGLRNGELLNFPQTIKLQEVAVKEAFKVIEASGMDLGMDLDECLSLVKTVCVKTGDNISSMLQDRLNGMETEIDFITGAVLKRAGQVGMDAPVNEMLTCLVSFNSRTKWRQFKGSPPDITGENGT